MNHGKKITKLGSSKGQQKAMISNLANSLLEYGHIKTTTARAQAVIPFVEHIVLRSKKEVDPNRYLMSKLQNEKVVDKVINEYFKRYKDETSGIVQRYILGNRKGDGARVVTVIMKGYEARLKTKLKKVKKEEAEGDEKKQEKSSGLTGKIKALGKNKVGKSQTTSADTRVKATTRSGI